MYSIDYLVRIAVGLQGDIWWVSEPWKNLVVNLDYTDKKENKFSSYIRKFRMEQLQSHI
jgi:hypothetical protein